MNLSIPSHYGDHLRVGTCSWKYDSWKGLVYDAGRRYLADDYLVDYSRHLNTVEVDQWFWSLFPAEMRLPEAKTSIVQPQDRGIREAVDIVRRNTTDFVTTYVNVNNHYEGSAPLTIERFLRELNTEEAR